MTLPVHRAHHYHIMTLPVHNAQYYHIMTLPVHRAHHYHIMTLPVHNAQYYHIMTLPVHRAQYYHIVTLPVHRAHYYHITTIPMYRAHHYHITALPSTVLSITTLPIYLIKDFRCVDNKICTVWGRANFMTLDSQLRSFCMWKPKSRMPPRSPNVTTEIMSFESIRHRSRKTRSSTVPSLACVSKSPKVYVWHKSTTIISPERRGHEEDKAKCQA